MTTSDPLRIRICLGYDRDALEAAYLYVQTFPDTAVGIVHHALSTSSGRVAAERAFDAMMQMTQIDVAAIKAAIRG